jgi:pyruvate/2-oxoglutarate dehydrogenase complex dihydrolipoamide dehydrogenase (E3) component
VGKSNIFCAGDLNNINEGKLAYRAEYHGKLIAKHIAALVKDPNVCGRVWAAIQYTDLFVPFI